MSDRLPLYVGMVRIIQRYLTTHLGLALSLSSQPARQVPTSSLLRFRAINNSLTSRMQEQVIESQTCSRRRAQWPQTASMRRKSRWHKTHNRGTLHFRNWPDSEMAQRPDGVRFLGYSGLVVLTASLSASDPEQIPSHTSRTPAQPSE